MSRTLDLEERVDELRVSIESLESEIEDLLRKDRVETMISAAVVAFLVTILTIAMR